MLRIANWTGIICKTIALSACVSFAVGDDAGRVRDWFAANVYGPIPPPPAETSFACVEQGPAFDGTAVRRQYRVVSRNAGESNVIDVLVYVPADARGLLPTFLCPNFYGNHTATEDEAERLSAEARLKSL